MTRKEMYKEQRDKLVVFLHKPKTVPGMPLVEIAKVVGLTRQQVLNITKKHDKYTGK